MKHSRFILALLPFAAAKCGAPNDSVCAQFVFSNGTVSQDILINDGGCTDIRSVNSISGIKVYDCWCRIWSASSSAACNNGNDEVVHKIGQCAGLVDGRAKGWKYVPTHVSCFRP